MCHNNCICLHKNFMLQFEDFYNFKSCMQIKYSFAKLLICMNAQVFISANIETYRYSCYKQSSVVCMYEFIYHMI